MGSIEKRQLHILVRSHIVGELHSYFLPFRATCREIILHYPLDEVFAIYGSLIVGAVLLIEAFHIFRASSRRNPVYHRIRERNILLGPFRKSRILSPEEAHEGLLSGVAVVLEIVAGKYGHFSGSVSHTLTKSFGNKSENSLRLRRIGKILPDSLVGKVELSGLLVDVVSSLRDCHRYDLSSWVRYLSDYLFRLLPGPDHLLYRSDLIRLILPVAAVYRQGILSVLVIKRVVESFVRRQKHRSGDGPVALRRIKPQKLIGVVRFVSAVEVAYSDMEDSAFYVAAVVVHSLDLFVFHQH